MLYKVANVISGSGSEASKPDEGASLTSVLETPALRIELALLVLLCTDSMRSELVATFDGREVTYGFGELDELVLAYATTIHKAQGSEYPAVVIPVMTQHYTMLARNLLYTGVTRGKRLVVLVGQRKAIAMAVRNGGQRRRWSKLGKWPTAT